MVRCYGGERPLRRDCYRFTTPTPGRAAFGRMPYDPETATCAEFITNLPPREHGSVRAYHLWRAAGRPEGRASAHWRQALAAAYRGTGRAPDTAKGDEP